MKGKLLPPLPLLPLDRGECLASQDVQCFIEAPLRISVACSVLEILKHLPDPRRFDLPDRSGEQAVVDDCLGLCDRFKGPVEVVAEKSIKNGEENRGRFVVETPRPHLLELFQQGKNISVSNLRAGRMEKELMDRRSIHGVPRWNR